MKAADLVDPPGPPSWNFSKKPDKTLFLEPIKIGKFILFKKKWY